MNGCKQCPAFAKCTIQPTSYRGSRCAALRSTYGVETDPEIVTNADRIRAMSDEELCFLFVNTERFANLMDVSYAEMMDWLRKPATGGE